MDKDYFIKMAGSQRELANILGISQAAVAQWKEIPEARLWQLSVLRPKWIRLCKHCGSSIEKLHAFAKICMNCKTVHGKKTGQAWAAHKVAKAVKEGLLKPVKTLTCVDCGAPAKHYDHRDYNKPLDVVPVCHSCNILRGPAIPLEKK